MDATEEIVAKASAYLREEGYRRWREADIAQSKIPLVGREVRIVGGRPTRKLEDGSCEKVALDTVGTVFHREERRSQHGTWSYGHRVGIAISDRKQPGWSLRVDGDRVHASSPYRDHFAGHARALGGTWDRGSREWVFPLALEEQARELFDVWFPGRWLDVVFTNEKNVEVAYPERYQGSEEDGRRIADRHCRQWRSFTAAPRPGLAFVG